MKGIADTIYTFRFLKLFSTKWQNTDAYKMGIIDDEGTPLKKVKELTPSEKNVYTAFIRLVFKFKRMMGKLPGGKSALARYGAAVLLIKEHSEEVERMGMNLKSLEEGFKKYMDTEEDTVLKERFVNNIDNQMMGKSGTFTYSANKKRDIEIIIRTAIGQGMQVDEDNNDLKISGSGSDHNSLIKVLTNRKVVGMVSEEVTTGVGGVEGKDQPLGKKGEVKKKKKSKDDEVVDKGKGKEDKNEEVSYSYQVIGGTLIRVDELKRVVKKRVRGQKRQKKREYVPTKRRTRTGKKKLRGGAKTKWKRSHKKAYRKAHTGSAAHKRKRSMKKSRKYNK